MYASVQSPPADPSHPADRRGEVGEKDRAEPERGEEERHLLQSVHLDAVGSLEVLVTRGRGRSHLVLSARLPDVQADDQIQQQREQRHRRREPLVHFRPPASNPNQFDTAELGLIEGDASGCPSDWYERRVSGQ